MRVSNYFGWSPLAEIMRLQDEINNLFKIRSNAGIEYPPVNLWSDEQKILLAAPMPGIAPEDINLTVRGNEISIEGEIRNDEVKEGCEFYKKERGAGKFVKSVKLPYEVDQNGVEARYVNGILAVTMPRHKEAMPKKIKIN